MLGKSRVAQNESATTMMDTYSLEYVRRLNNSGMHLGLVMLLMVLDDDGIDCCVEQVHPANYTAFGRSVRCVGGAGLCRHAAPTARSIAALPALPATPGIVWN